MNDDLACVYLDDNIIAIAQSHKWCLADEENAYREFVPITVTVLAVTLLTTSLSLNHDEWLVH
jgi:hypothetical protein